MNSDEREPACEKLSEETEDFKRISATHKLLDALAAYRDASPEDR